MLTGQQSDLGSGCWLSQRVRLLQMPLVPVVAELLQLLAAAEERLIYIEGCCCCNFFCCAANSCCTPHATFLG
jgi:hypothetical protein